MKKEITLIEAQEIINNALTRFYSQDQALIDSYSSIKNAVSENCMLFRIGWYMHEYVKNKKGFESLSIDCQYNRNFEHPKSMFASTLSGIETKIKDPIPDLLLHQRGSNNNNIFLIELKKGKPKKNELDNDVEKLCYFTDDSHEYKYKFGFSIWLYKKAHAKIKVYIDGKERSHLNYVWRINLLHNTEK